MRGSSGGPILVLVGRVGATIVVGTATGEEDFLTSVLLFDHAYFSMYHVLCSVRRTLWLYYLLPTVEGEFPVAMKFVIHCSTPTV